MLIYFIFFILTLIYFLFMYISWNEDYWLKQRIPFIEPEKLFGNIKDIIFMKKTIGEVYQEIYRKLDGKPLGGFFVMRRPILMVRNLDLIAEVLGKRFDCFHDNDIHIRRGTDPILKMNPFLATGSTWNPSRSVLTPLESHETLEGLLNVIKANCKEMVNFIKKQEISIEVTELSNKYTSDVLAACSFGIEPNSFKKCDTEFGKRSAKLLETNIKSNVALLCALYAPIFGNLFNFRIISKDVSEYFIGIVSEKCKQRVKDGIKKKDFLQRLIDINKESEASGEGTVYSYQSIMGHCMAIFINGCKMTSDPLSFCLYELAMNPDVQNKLKNEIKSFRLSSVDELSYYMLQNMEYLEKIVCECLRLHPPMPTLTRVCTRQTELSHGGLSYRVEQGVPVTVPIYAIHMDPGHFPQPTKFDPSRFNFDQVKHRHPYAYLPFGAGPRSCPGAKFAKLILKIALIAIALNFDVRPRGAIKEVEHDPRKSLILSAKGGMWLSFKENTTIY